MITRRLVRRSWGRFLVALLVSSPLVSSSLTAAAAAPELAKAEKGSEKESKTVDSVREALQREVYGLNADRDQLLQQAVEADPEAALPHWYLGQVRTAEGKWQAADAQPSSRQAEATREYQTLRATKKDDATGNRQLADWCQKHGLKQQERAHLIRLLELGSTQADVRTRLDMVRVGDQWFDKTAVAQEQLRQKSLRELHTRWLPIITQLATQVTSPDATKRDAAVAEIVAIRDVGLLPLLQAVFAPRSEDHQLLVIKACAKIPDPAATDLLVRQAVHSPSTKVREAAVALLKDRDQAGFVPLLISAMYTPVEVKTSSVMLPGGAIATRQAFWREGEGQHELIVRDQLINPRRGNRSTAAMDIDLHNRTVRAAEDREALAKVAAEAENVLNERRNRRVSEVLTAVTGEEHGVDAAAWWKWWSELNDTYLPQKGVVTSYSSGVTQVQGLSAPAPACECFAAGTPVWTDQGPQPIENLRLGDLVLARDVETGELAYKPVLRTTLRPKRPLKIVTIGDDVFECTPGHLFWVSGEGWVRARDLRPGQLLHTATGPVTVAKVDEGRAAETYNLIVADFRTYFVGQQKILSHDVTARQATRSVVPGLQPE